MNGSRDPEAPIEAEERELLNVARAAVDRVVRGLPLGPPAEAETESPAMAFVTLRKGGELRGCIGSLEGRLSLSQVVAECAAAAATRDPRFPPVSVDELPDLEISISVIGEFRDLESPDEIEIGRHGLLFEGGGRRGLLLPQVAAEMKLDATQFLDQVCLKAGAPAGAWRQGARVQIFTAREIPAKTR